eukprot:COSAG04_NODE_5684_length_1527_cov_4.095941_1_plen_324_part_00
MGNSASSAAPSHMDVEFCQAVRRGDAADVQGRLEGGWSKDAKDDTGRPAIVIAAEAQDHGFMGAGGGGAAHQDGADGHGVLGCLVRAGADLEAVTTPAGKSREQRSEGGQSGATRQEERRGMTALMVAAASNQPEFVQFLLQSGANPNAVDAGDVYGRAGGMTALMHASRAGSLECVRHLLAGGADATLRDITGMKFVRGRNEAGDAWTAVQWAQRHSHAEVAAALLEHGAPAALCTAAMDAELCQAVRQGGAPGVQRLLDGGWNKDARDERGGARPRYRGEGPAPCVPCACARRGWWGRGRGGLTGMAFSAASCGPERLWKP